MWKKIRAAFGVATTWALAWGAWGVLTTGAYALFGVGFPIPWEVAGLAAIRSGLLGFVGGTLFSIVLGSRFSANSLQELRPGRLAMLGALGGVLVPVAATAALLAGFGMAITVPVLLQTALAYGVPGLVTAYATVRLAQAGARSLDDGDSWGRLSGG